MMKRAPIDVRLVNPSFGDWKHSKINNTVKTVSEVYKETAKEKGTQIIFLNRGRNNDTGVDLYRDLVANS